MPVGIRRPWCPETWQRCRMPRNCRASGAAGEAPPRPYTGYRVTSRRAYRVLRRMHTTAAVIDVRAAGA